MAPTETDSFQGAIEKYKVTSPSFRTEKRDLWNKVILLSSAILGFSVTIFSKELSIIVSLCFLKVGWVMFLVNILCGLFLLKKEGEFEQQQILANLMQEWDKTEINIPVKTQNDKDKFLTLTYLHGLRTTPEKENPYSQLAKDIFEKNKTLLTSWQMIKNPQKFYAYNHMKIISIGSNIFYGSFVFGIILLISAVIF